MAVVELDYLACDLRTGVVIEELQSLTPTEPLQSKLGVSSTVNADLAVQGAPRDWVYATQPGRSLVVAVDRLTQQPIWSGIVLTRTRGSGPTATLGLVTPEAYLDRRYTGTYGASGGADQVAIMSGVAGPVFTDGPMITTDVTLSGVTGTYSVLDGDDRSILSALQELQQQDGWPEWTISMRWADADHRTVTLVLTIAPHVGIVRPDPEAVFDLPGCITGYTLTESYEAGKGATVVLARGNGEGDSRLTSAAYTAGDLIAAGWPRWVYRFTPAANLNDPNALNACAAKALSQQRTGSSAWSITAAADAAPRLGRDWTLGDSVRVTVGASPGHPDGAEVTARAYAWSLDPASNTVSPILVEDDT